MQVRQAIQVVPVPQERRDQLAVLEVPGKREQVEHLEERELAEVVAAAAIVRQHVWLLDTKATERSSSHYHHCHTKFYCRTEHNDCLPIQIYGQYCLNLCIIWKSKIPSSIIPNGLCLWVAVLIFDYTTTNDNDDDFAYSKINKFLLFFYHSTNSKQL